jgi:hypothetical protein
MRPLRRLLIGPGASATLSIFILTAAQLDRCRQWRRITFALQHSGHNIGSSLFGPWESSAYIRSASPTLTVDDIRGSALLFGISRLALPGWDQ